MLNGIDPLIIFEFSKDVDPDAKKELQNCLKDCLGGKGVPVQAREPEKEWLPPIPVYLSEKITGLYIDSTQKNIDIETTVEPTADDEDPIVNQKGVNSTITLNMVASSKSIGLTLMLALSDLIFKRVTEKDYRVTLFYGAVTIFGGYLRTFAVTQTADNDLYQITLELTSGKIATQDKPQTPTVPKITGATPL
jgi:hypothetical protein